MATARAIRRAYEKRLSALDLNLSQALLLGFLHESGPVTQTRLAERLDRGRAATGSVIDALENRGLVERHPDPGDGRVWMVAATGAGKERGVSIHQIDRELRSEMRTGISREERRQLAQLLLRLQSNLAAVLGEDDR